MASELPIFRLAQRNLRTRYGIWSEYLYYDGTAESAALVYGDIEDRTAVLCRLHSACMSAHVFNSIECDCREQMEIAQVAIQAAGAGVVIWLDQEGRGNGHLALMRAADIAVRDGIGQTEAYQRLGFPIDHRRYSAAAAILTDLGVQSITLLSDNPRKAAALTEHGVPVGETRSVSVSLKQYPQLRSYYADKLAQGYTLDVTDGDQR